jgi:uncharacterized protein YfdQ (DUF2303 family)
MVDTLNPSDASLVESLRRALLAGMRNTDDLLRQHVFLPDDVRLVDLECLLNSPTRIRHAATLTDVESFNRYLKRHGENGTIVYYPPVTQASASTVIARAAVDAHGGGNPDWAEHTAELVLKASPEYLAWTGKNGSWMDQVGFAEWLEDNLCDVVTPPAASLLSLVKNLKIIRNVAFRSAVSLESGEVQMEYVEKDEQAGKIKGAGQVRIPDRIIIKIPVFLGDDPICISASFRYRLNEGAVTFAYKLQGLDRLVLERCRALVSVIDKENPELVRYSGYGTFNNPNPKK